MNKLFKYGLIVAGINIAVLICLIFASNFTNDMGSGLFLIIAVPAILLFLQLVVAIILAVRDSTRLLGQGILVGVGLFFLIGLSICGIFSMGNFL